MYKRKNITLYNKDCMEVIKKLPNASIDLVLIDPPYELETHGGGNRKQWANIHNNFISDLSSGFNYKEVFKELLRVCRIPNLLIFCSNKQISKIMSYFEELKLSTTLLCWYKEGYVPFANGKHMSDVEFIVYVRGKNAHWNNDVDIKLKSKVLRDNWRIKNKIHPTQKSLEVLKHLVELHSFKGDTVLDCYMGSGSTGIASLELERKFIGVEINKEYYGLAKKRLVDYLDSCLEK